MVFIFGPKMPTFYKNYKKRKLTKLFLFFIITVTRTIFHMTYYAIIMFGHWKVELGTVSFSYTIVCIIAC